MFRALILVGAVLCLAAVLVTGSAFHGEDGSSRIPAPPPREPVPAEPSTDTDRDEPPSPSVRVRPDRSPGEEHRGTKDPDAEPASNRARSGAVVSFRDTDGPHLVGALRLPGGPRPKEDTERAFSEAGEQGAQERAEEGTEAVGESSARGGPVLRRPPVGDATELDAPWVRLLAPGEDRDLGTGPAPDVGAAAGSGGEKPESWISVRLGIRTPGVDGATITVNRRKVGVAPLELGVRVQSPGDLQVQARKDGFATVTRVMRLGADHPGGFVEVLLPMRPDLPRPEDDTEAPSKSPIEPASREREGNR